MWETSVNPSALPSKVRILDLPHWGNAPVTSTNTGHRGVSRSRSFTAVHGSLRDSPGTLSARVAGRPRGPRPHRAAHACPEPPAPVPGLSRPPALAVVPGVDRGRPGSPRGGPGAPPPRRGCAVPQWGRRGSHSPRSSDGPEGVPDPVRRCFPDSAGRGFIAVGTRADNANVRSPFGGAEGGSRARMRVDLRFRCWPWRAGARSPPQLRG
jgi:hypothetical protein